MIKPQPISKLLCQLSRNKSAQRSSVDLLVDHGFIKQAGSGFFDLLPLGLRIQKKISAIVRKHLDRHDCTELELSTLVNPQLWKASGRLKETPQNTDKVDANTEFIFTADKKHLLAPTAEEQITSLVGSVSYRHLPLSLYQITRKYRNELRPREGLLRTREFLMKDLYTFDLDAESAGRSYNRIKQAYHDIFEEIGVPFIAAEADSGNMGGNLSHEYHYINELGEDSVVTCRSCNYAANMEKAVSRGPQVHRLESVTIVDGAKIPHGRTLNPVLLAQAQSSGSPLVDWRIDPVKGVPLVEPIAGETCVKCGSELGVDLSIEIGHTFYLADRYSKPLKANVFPPSGPPRPLEMGCYGIGINRIIGAVASKMADEYGLVWPRSIAPYSCCVIAKDTKISAEVAQILASSGIETVYEDRSTQLGQTMRSARESGYPLTLVLGKSWESSRVIEILPRTGAPRQSTLENLVAEVQQLLR